MGNTPLLMEIFAHRWSISSCIPVLNSSFCCSIIRDTEKMTRNPHTNLRKIRKFSFLSTRWIGTGSPQQCSAIFWWCLRRKELFFLMWLWLMNKIIGCSYLQYWGESDQWFFSHSRNLQDLYHILSFSASSLVHWWGGGWYRLGC
jgi:hypothetical protein